MNETIISARRIISVAGNAALSNRTYEETNLDEIINWLVDDLKSQLADK